MNTALQDSYPHDDTLEKGLFGVLLIFPDQFSEYADSLVPSDFYVESHQIIWKAMQDLFKEGKEIDFPNLRMQLKASDVNPTRALEVLGDALQEDTRMHHLDDLVKEIKNKSLLRQIIRMCKAHAYSGQLDGAKAQGLLQELERDMLAIADKSLEASPTDAVGITTEIEHDIEQGMKDGWKGFSSGFIGLDERTGGFIPAQVWIIGAYTGVGKTFLLLQMLLSVLREGGRVALFSTEMDRKLNVLRLLGNISGLGTIQMMRNNLDPEQQKDLKKAKEEIRSFGSRLIIYDNIYTVEEIRLKIKKLQMNGGVNVVAVDYLQNLRGEGSIYEKMSVAATELFRIAQELKPTLLIGSQVSQAAAGWQSKEAIEFKGAGEIAAVSDVSLWMKKVDDAGGREILLRKVRHGAPGILQNVKLEFPSGKFIDPNKAMKEEDNADIKGQLK